ncbi:MAG: peptidoglycan-binding protein LysM [Nitrospirae bacterium]|nr:peptidoglycan-binding protein LysM [Nitrospirota bacterium]
MGLFDFIKEAGSKIFGTDEDAEPRPQTTAYSPEEIQKINDRRRAMALARTIESLDFEIEDLGIRVDDDLATVSGQVLDQATKERIVLALGNTAGIARVDDRIEVETAEPEAQFHTVEAGDTLSAIAQKYYGNSMKYPVIFEANKPMLSDPDKIYPGQVLRIPLLE